MSNPILSKNFEDKDILFDSIENELYLNATKTAKSFNKLIKHWLENKETKQYIESLYKKFPDRRNSDHGDFIVIRRGGNEKNNQGTWIHQKLIIFFARWLSSDFAVWCDLQIEEILKSKNLQPVQTSHDFDNFNFVEQTQKNREILELIELITSQNPKNLFFLDKIYKKISEKSPLDLLGIDLNSFYFIPTELGKFFNKSAVEINKILEAKGFQEKINGVWVLTKTGKKYAIQLDNNFQTIKWKLESLV